MKDSYIYKAEYVSKVNGQHYLNIDLGFQTWKVIKIDIDNPPSLGSAFKHGDMLKIITYLRKSNTSDRKYPVKYHYSCEVLEKETYGK